MSGSGETQGKSDWTMLCLVSSKPQPLEFSRESHGVRGAYQENVSRAFFRDLHNFENFLVSAVAR